MKCRRSTASKGAPLRARVSGPMKSDAAAADPAAAADLRIDSPTNGPILHRGSVIVGPQGVVCGPVRARVIIVEGEVTGDLHADEAIRIIGRGRVHGDVHAPRVAMASGAQLRGRLTMPRRPEPATVSE
jgi:cytoskeletal protein CcmA (bactofilin family)